MKEYYLSKAGKLSRQHNTLVYSSDDDGVKKRLPIQSIKSIHMGSGVKLTSDTIVFLNKNNVDLHFYNYKMDYRCSMTDPLGSGDVTVMQVEHMSDLNRRLSLAKKILSPGFSVMSKLSKLELPLYQKAESINELMGYEGSFRKKYYKTIFGSDLMDQFWKFKSRSKRPPADPINCLISFFNMLCYSVCQSAISSTQLNSNISFLHSSYGSKQSLRLDISEIFKPTIVDRLILDIIDKSLMNKEHFDMIDGVCLLNNKGKRLCYKLWDDQINNTFYYENLKRNISYKTMIKIECNKLVKHILGIEKYEPIDLCKLTF